MSYLGFKVKQKVLISTILTVGVASLIVSIGSYGIKVVPPVLR